MGVVALGRSWWPTGGVADTGTGRGLLWWLLTLEGVAEMGFCDNGEPGVGRRIGVAAAVGMFFWDAEGGRAEGGRAEDGGSVEGSVEEEEADAVVVTMDGVMAVGVVVVVEVIVVTVLAVTVAMGVAGVVVVGLTVTVGTPPLHRAAAVVEGGVTATTGRTWFTRPAHTPNTLLTVCLPSSQQCLRCLHKRFVNSHSNEQKGVWPRVVRSPATERCVAMFGKIPCTLDL